MYKAWCELSNATLYKVELFVTHEIAYETRIILLNIAIEGTG